MWESVSCWAPPGAGTLQGEGRVAVETAANGTAHASLLWAETAALRFELPKADTSCIPWLISVHRETKGSLSQLVRKRLITQSVVIHTFIPLTFIEVLLWVGLA